MKIISIRLDKKNNTSFGKIVFPDEDIRKKILKGLTENQLDSLKKGLLNQQNNPIHAIIGQNKCGLNAKIFCEYRLKNFKEYYRQIPFFESNINFIKRIIKKCDEYKKQLD